MSVLGSIALGMAAARARELRRQLALARAELKAGRLASTATLLDRSIRELDAGLEDARRAGVV